VRVIYYFHSERMPLYLLTLFAKNEGKPEQGRAQRVGKFGGSLAIKLDGG
jgi:hypothetical protein